MGEMQRAVIRHSVNDVIGVLENQPVRPGMNVGLTVAQVMNRVSIAHLSIERAMKFVITEAGGDLIKDHDLPSRLKELRQHEPGSAKFLEEAYEAAVRHYRYNANATHMKHLKSLETYLEATASDKHFQDIRYWELTQSTGEIIVRQIYLTLHMELLHAMSEILLAPGRPKDIVTTRVERAVRDAMSSRRELSYSTGSDKQRSVEAYIEWLNGFKGFGEALTVACKEGFATGDKFMLETLRKAYQELSESKDPAVRYFAETLAVLPKQQRDALPCVEWLGPEPLSSGMVSTPGGDGLGFIDRRSDGTWAITPSRNGLVAVSAIAESQTDARCYLADLLTRAARVTVGDEERQLRIVGEEHNLFKRYHEQVMQWFEDRAGAEESIFQVTFWDNTHGITSNDVVRVEIQSRTSQGVADILEGKVTEVNDHEVFVQGMEHIAVI